MVQIEMSTNEMRSSTPGPVVANRPFRGRFESGMISKSQVVVAAEVQELLVADRDESRLRAFDDNTVSPKLIAFAISVLGFKLMSPGHVGELA